MPHKRTFLTCILCLIILIPCGSWAQIVPGNVRQAGEYALFDNVHNSYMSLGFRKYINSFTSYEFLDPDFRHLDPLSRLEWPWEQVYGVVKTGIFYKGLQVNLEGASTLFLYSGLKAQDSDWTDVNLPGQKTIFSDAEARPRGWTFDASLGFDLPFSNRIRWIAGYRVQRFRFTYTDMYQSELYHPEHNGFEPGEVIQFTQDYKHLYGGGVIGSEFDMSFILDSLAGSYLLLLLQGDIGYVAANNVDFHALLEPGPRHTYEATNGTSWRLRLAASLRMNQRFSVGLAGEFMRIRTYGSHTLTDPSVNESWQGARVWSDQKFLELTTTVNF